MARKRKSGQRTRSGQLSRSLAAMIERNPPNERAVALRERFRHFRGDSSIGTEMTCVGRLMLVGAFDGLDVPAETLLESVLNYSIAYWGHYTGLSASGAAYERSDRSHDSSWADPAGRWFDECDARLRSAGARAREAVLDVSVDRHWFPDQDVHWAARVINSRILQKIAQFKERNKPVPEGLTIAGELADDNDWAMLDLLRAGALALAGTTARKKAA